MKKMFLVVCAVYLSFFCLLMPVHADMGPKPSVIITFSGLTGKALGTLLSAKDST